MEELYFKLTSPDSEGLTDEEFEEYKALTTNCEINERKVLKVGAPKQVPQDIQQNNIPDMNGDMPMGDNAMIPSENDIPEMDDDGQSDFDTNFDAGVEADEDEDPKKYIQQLTGKLSQELGKYNNETNGEDAELSKYVGGMIVKQVAKTLSDSDKKELIKKIKTTNSSNEEGDEPEGDDFSDEGGEMPMESYSLDRKGLKKIFETFNAEINDDEKDSKKITKKNAYKEKSNKPFIAPNFK